MWILKRRSDVRRLILTVIEKPAEKTQRDFVVLKSSWNENIEKTLVAKNLDFCSRQRSKPTRPPLAIQATWGVISRWKILPELFQSFGTLAERGRERKGTWTHQLLPSLVLYAPNNGQPASQLQTDTTAVLKALNGGLPLERERRLNH